MNPRAPIAIRLARAFLAAASFAAVSPARAVDEEGDEAAVSSPADPVSGATSALRGIEREIERALEDGVSREARLQELREAIDMVDVLARSDRELAGRNREELSKQRGALDREIDAMTSVAAAAYDGLDRSRRSIELAAPLALASARRSGPTSPGAVAAALAHARHREDARSSIDRVFQAEELRSRRAAERDAMDRRIAEFAELARMDASGLRARRAELEAAVADLRRLESEERARLESLRAGRGSLAAVVESGDAARSRDILAAVAALRLTGADTARPASYDPAPDRISGTYELGGGPDDLPEIGYEPARGARVSSAGRVPSGPAPSAPPEFDSDRDRETFADPPAANVRALASGTVVFSGPFTGYEHLLILDHGGGWLVVYANLAGSPLREGDRVEPGAVVGSCHLRGSDRSRRGDPFWIEARKGERSRPVSELPGAGTDWRRKLFAE